MVEPRDLAIQLGVRDKKGPRGGRSEYEKWLPQYRLLEYYLDVLNKRGITAENVTRCIKVTDDRPEVRDLSAVVEFQIVLPRALYAQRDLEPLMHGWTRLVVIEMRAKEEGRPVAIYWPMLKDLKTGTLYRAHDEHVISDMRTGLNLADMLADELLG